MYSIEIIDEKQLTLKDMVIMQDPEASTEHQNNLFNVINNIEHTFVSISGTPLYTENDIIEQHIFDGFIIDGELTITKYKHNGHVFIQSILTTVLRETYILNFLKQIKETI